MSNISELDSKELLQYIPSRRGKIKAQVSTLEKGIKTYENLSLIRVKDTKTTFMILEDYMPVVGEVHGEVILLGLDQMITLKDIHGFYVHKRNEFFLLLKEKVNVG